MAEQKSDKIGALWLKTAKSGQKFMSGVVEHNGEKIQLVVFKNTKKEKENQPDYNIILGKPLEPREHHPGEGFTPTRMRQPGEETSIGVPPDKFTDDIPF